MTRIFTPKKVRKIGKSPTRTSNGPRASGGAIWEDYLGNRGGKIGNERPGILLANPSNPKIRGAIWGGLLQGKHPQRVALLGMAPMAPKGMLGMFLVVYGPGPWHPLLGGGIQPGRGS